MRNSIPLLSLFSSALLFFGQINEQNQEGLDSIENPEIMRVLDL
jgi:hypothetical protein